MLRDAAEAERAERDQDADCARIEAAIGIAKQAITALEHQQLDAEEMQKKWATMRDQTILVLREVRRNVIRRAKEAKETESSMCQQIWQEQNDGMVARQFSAELTKVPTQQLLHYLRYLIQVDDLARIQSICMVFKARADHQRYDSSFDEMLAQFARAKCGALGERLVRISRSAERTDAMIANLLSCNPHDSIRYDHRHPHLPVPMAAPAVAAIGISGVQSQDDEKIARTGVIAVE